MLIKNGLIKQVVVIAFVAIAVSCQTDKYCQKFKSGKCQYCVYRYPDSQGVCQTPTTNIPNCYSYSSAGVCGECKEGYYKNSSPTGADQVCLLLDDSIRQHCAISYVSQLLCSVCDFGVLTDSGFCHPENKCSDPNCKRCYFNTNGQEICYECNKKFLLWSGVEPGICIPANQFEGCFESSRLDICENCNVGYYYDNGVCSTTSKTEY